MARNLRETRAAAAIAEVTRLDLEFHDLVFEAAGHRRLERLWQSVRHEIEFWLAVLHRDHDERTRRTRAETVEAHEELLACLRGEKPSAAERLMREHILGWREWLPLEQWNLPAPLAAPAHS